MSQPLYLEAVEGQCEARSKPDHQRIYVSAFSSSRRAWDLKQPHLPRTTDDRHSAINATSAPSDSRDGPSDGRHAASTPGLRVSKPWGVV